MSRDARKNSHLAHVLYGALICGPHEIAVVARRSGITASSLYDACENRRDLPARWLPRIYAATHDIPLYAALSGIADAGLVLSAPGDVVDEQSVLRAGLHVGASAGRAQLAVVDAAADGIITDAEQSAIERELDDLERRAATLRSMLRKRSTGVAR